MKPGAKSERKDPVIAEGLLPEEVELQAQQAMNPEPAKMTRRSFSLTALRISALAFLVKAGILPKSALAEELHGGSEASPEGGDEAGETISDAYLEKMAGEPMSLVALDAFGTLAFVDAIVSIAREKDSVAQRLFMLAGLPTYNTGELDDPHKAKFPLENIHLAVILNIIRASAYGHKVREHTIKEFITTLNGVGLLLGLTSMAKGIIAAESKTGEMAKAGPEAIVMDPEKVISNSIFQLSVVAASTQLPLTAFGNAGIGNSEFKEVKQAFNTIYFSLLPDSNSGLDFAGVKNYVEGRLAEVDNPEVAKRVRKILGAGPSSLAELRPIFKKEATAHTNDLMTLLMSTACDDAQAAMGDAGPLVGLYQMFGSDFLKAVPAILPYTVMIGFERASFAAKRAGLKTGDVLTKERFNYLGKFLKATWKNLAIYFVNVAPKISAKITGSERFESANGNGSDVGRDFTLIEQVTKDLERVLGTVMDSILGSFNGNTLDLTKVKSALQTLHYAERDFERELGRQVVEKAKLEGVGDEVNLPLRREGINEVKERIVGPLSDQEELRDLQARVENLAMGADTQAVESFAATLKDLRDEMGPLLMEQLKELETKSGGKTPSIKAVAKLLQENPKVRDLLDFNHWHHKIGSELTDTMFVVFLQGLHLAFIINTMERAVYNNPVFKKMPLLAQESFSILLNDAVSMFADNWADCVAHSKWLTTMYFNELSKTHDVLAERYPEAKSMIEGATYFEDTSSALVPERFSARKQQFSALIVHLKDKYPGDSAALDEIHESYIERAEKYYYKAMVMAMVASVTGGGKAKTGNAPHFTFAAGENDFTLAETLKDFKRHPIYHLWEFLFSTGYAIFVGPEIANTLFGKAASKQIHEMMQKQFRAKYPEFEKKLNELKAREMKQHGEAEPGTVRMKTRRAALGLDKFREAVDRTSLRNRVQEEAPRRRNPRASQSET